MAGAQTYPKWLLACKQHITDSKVKQYLIIEAINMISSSILLEFWDKNNICYKILKHCFKFLFCFMAKVKGILLSSPVNS
jgi:hypothetical protein